MAAQYGRSTKRWAEVYLDDSAGTLRQLSGVQTFSGVGLEYPAEDVTALVDAIKNALPGTPDCKIELAGKIDTKANVGTHIVLSGVNGLGVPLSFDVRFGIGHAWEAGEPQFGITADTTTGMICVGYTVDQDMNFKATLVVKGGTAPAWGTAAET